MPVFNVTDNSSTISVYPAPDGVVATILLFMFSVTFLAICCPFICCCAIIAIVWLIVTRRRPNGYSKVELLVFHSVTLSMVSFRKLLKSSNIQTFSFHPRIRKNNSKMAKSTTQFSQTTVLLLYTVWSMFTCFCYVAICIVVWFLAKKKFDKPNATSAA
ncbi:hypothetical protein CAEBREN_24800 [Caenorhabditis brenneri]|uniref:Uncharacterized protein n=1 Tax=Caenorhabditis brenneri TaxID=135651 RepID=G0N5J3_CAEBE|nr:hypothetical protein CAEBREN_24800 [Caenorhabditis brenneri]